LFYYLLIFLYFFSWFFSLTKKNRQLRLDFSFSLNYLLRFRRLILKYKKIRSLKLSNLMYFKLRNFVGIQGFCYKKTRPFKVNPLKIVNIFWSNELSFLESLKRGLFILRDLIINYFNFRLIFFLFDKNLSFLLDIFFKKMHFSKISNFWLPGAFTNSSLIKHKFELFSHLNLDKFKKAKINNVFKENYSLKYKQLLLFLFDLRFLYGKLPSFSISIARDMYLYPLISELRLKKLFSFGFSSNPFYTISLLGNINWIFFRLGFIILCSINILDCLEKIRNKTSLTLYGFFSSNFKKIFNSFFLQFKLSNFKLLSLIILGLSRFFKIFKYLFSYSMYSKLFFLKIKNFSLINLYIHFFIEFFYKYCLLLFKIVKLN
jgi:hypothetical protein